MEPDVPTAAAATETLDADEAGATEAAEDVEGVAVGGEGPSPSFLSVITDDNASNPCVS